MASLYPPLSFSSYRLLLFLLFSLRGPAHLVYLSLAILCFVARPLPLYYPLTPSLNMSSISCPSTPWLEDRPQIRLFDTPTLSPVMAIRFCWESPLNNVYASAWWMNTATKHRTIGSAICTPNGSLNGADDVPAFEGKIGSLSLSLSPCVTECSSSSEYATSDGSDHEEDQSDAETEGHYVAIEKLVQETIARLELETEVYAQVESKAEASDDVFIEGLETTTRVELDFMVSDDGEMNSAQAIIVNLPKVSLPAKLPLLPSTSMTIDPDLEASNPEQVRIVPCIPPTLADPLPSLVQATTARNVCMWGRRLERIPKVRVPGQPEAVYCFDPKRLAPKMERLLRVRYGSLPMGGKGRIGIPVGASPERRFVNVNMSGARLRTPSGNGTWNGNGNASSYCAPPSTPSPASVSTPSSFSLNTRSFPSLPSQSSESSTFSFYSQSTSWSYSAQPPATPSPAPRATYSSATSRSRQVGNAQGYLVPSLSNSNSNLSPSWRRGPPTSVPVRPFTSSNSTRDSLVV